MSMQNITNQNSVIISNADTKKLEMLKQFMQQNNISPDVLKQVTKAPKEKFNYIDETHEMAICNACSKEFIIASIPQDFIDTCKKQGICPECAAIFAQAESLKAALKTKNISSRGSKVIINGGKNVGTRLKVMFYDAITSPNFTEEIFVQFLDTEYSRKVLKFSSYPFLINITNINEKEQSENKNFYKRFYSKPYQIFDKTVKLCSQIFDRQFEACQKEFKKLNLIDTNTQY